MNIKLAQIDISCGQARAEINQATVDEYSSAWLDGAKFPLSVVFFDGVIYHLADGFHRFFGAQKAGLLDLNCDVRKGTQADAVWFAVAANQQHGLKRTNADKRRAVEIALREKPEMADNALAKHVGVSFHTVAELRVLLRVREVELSPPVRTGLDGKKRSAPPPPQKPAIKPPTAPPKPPPATPAIVDKTGWPIPAHLLPLWARRQDVQDELTAISHIRARFKELQETKDELYAEVNAQEGFADASRLRMNVELAMPFAVCTCLGKNSQQCTLCKGRGMISEFRWKHTVPEETKSMRQKLISAAHL